MLLSLQPGTITLARYQTYLDSKIGKDFTPTICSTPRDTEVHRSIKIKSVNSFLLSPPKPTYLAGQV
jgi:hypothetical protein